MNEFVNLGPRGGESQMPGEAESSGPIKEDQSDWPMPAIFDHPSVCHLVDIICANVEVAGQYAKDVGIDEIDHTVGTCAADALHDEEVLLDGGRQVGVRRLRQSRVEYRGNVRMHGNMIQTARPRGKTCAGGDRCRRAGGGKVLLADFVRSYVHAYNLAQQGKDTTPKVKEFCNA